MSGRRNSVIEKNIIENVMFILCDSCNGNPKIPIKDVYMMVNQKLRFSKEDIIMILNEMEKKKMIEYSYKSYVKVK